MIKCTKQLQPNTDSVSQDDIVTYYYQYNKYKAPNLVFVIRLFVDRRKLQHPAMGRNAKSLMCEYLCVYILRV